MTPEETYRRILDRRMRRNADRVLHGQDGKGNDLSAWQMQLLAKAIDADQCDWMRSWQQDVIADRGLL
jgi:hypothetical protein